MPYRQYGKNIYLQLMMFASRIFYERYSHISRFFYNGLNAGSYNEIIFMLGN